MSQRLVSLTERRFDSCRWIFVRDDGVALDCNAALAKGSALRLVEPPMGSTENPIMEASLGADYFSRGSSIRAGGGCVHDSGRLRSGCVVGIE